MNYSTMRQETNEPILNREVRLSLRTILGAAAFACGPESKPSSRAPKFTAFTPSSPRDTAPRVSTHRSFVIGALAVVAVAPSQSNKDVAFYNHHGWNGDATCDKKACDPDSTSNANCPSKHCPLCLDQGDGYRCTSHGEVHPKATSPTCEELYATALKKLAIAQENDKLHQLALGGIKFSVDVSDGQLDEQLETLRKKVEIAELREKLDHPGG